MTKWWTSVLLSHHLVALSDTKTAGVCLRCKNICILVTTPSDTCRKTAQGWVFEKLDLILASWVTAAGFILQQCNKFWLANKALESKWRIIKRFNMHLYFWYCFHWRQRKEDEQTTKAKCQMATSQRQPIWLRGNEDRNFLKWFCHATLSPHYVYTLTRGFQSHAGGVIILLIIHKNNKAFTPVLYWLIWFHHNNSWIITRPLSVVISTAVHEKTPYVSSVFKLPGW